MLMNTWILLFWIISTIVWLRISRLCLLEEGKTARWKIDWIWPFKKNGDGKKMGWIWPTEALDRQIHLVLLQDAQYISHVAEKNSERTIKPVRVIFTLSSEQNIFCSYINIGDVFQGLFLCPQAYTLGIDIIYKLRFFFCLFFKCTFVRKQGEKKTYCNSKENAVSILYTEENSYVL